MAVFDPASFTIVLQSAGDSCDWRIWHYVVAGDVTLDDVSADGFFSPMGGQITQGSIVYVVAPTYVAHLVLVKSGVMVTGKVLSSVVMPVEVVVPPAQMAVEQPMGGDVAVGEDAVQPARG